VAIAVAGIGLGCILIYRFLATGSVHPAVLLLLAAVISVALPMLRSNLFPGARDCAVEYDFHEKRLEEQNRLTIAAALGQDTFNQISMPSGGLTDSHENYFRQLLKKEQVDQDPGLRFALLLTIARNYEKNGDAQASIQYLTEALESHPYHFLANFRLALNHEWIGSEENAVDHYRQALHDPDGISRGMRKWTVAQIKRLQSGPG
jgi:tetratricopeptide (TPR) repeat protein